MQSSDLWLGRFGGEEFVVILPDTAKSQAFDIAKQLRITLAEIVMPAPSSWAWTGSSGIAEHSGQNTPELLEQADQVMYHAKACSRNVVCS